jgi:hypothetical protein
MMGTVPQVQDLFAESPVPWWYWPAFFVLVFFGWAFPVHFAARRTFASDAVWNRLTRDDKKNVDRQVLRGSYLRTVRWVPRLLGFACFGAVARGISGAYDNLAAANFKEASQELGSLSTLWWLNLATCAVFVAFILLRSSRRAPHSRGDILLARVYMVAGAGALVWLCADPAANVPLLPRATFLVLILGAPVIPFAYLAVCSHRYRFPILLSFIGTLFVVAGYFNDNSVRTIKDGSFSPVQISIDNAAAQWMRANGCQQAQACPSPIIIAGQGGASRAAFFTASTIGLLLDLGAKSPEEYPNVARRLFAFSTTSGASLGAVVIRTALADAAAAENPGPPCKKADRLWFGASTEGENAPTRSWRSCLEALLAGDFLSPVFVGLALRDHIPFGSDRAAVLEWAWERRYEALTGKNSLAGPFGHVFEIGKRTQSDWLPLLFLNATALSKGRRVVVSEVLPWRRVGGPTGWADGIFPEAYDFFDLLGHRNSCRDVGLCSDVELSAAVKTDVRLSTAAALSARFPIISPPGAVSRPPFTEIPREYIVDGGYFDNDGLVTARDIARALTGLGLKPIIVHLRNEPLVIAAPGEKPEPPFDEEIPQLPYSPPLPMQPLPRYVFGLSVPILALYTVRGSRFYEAERAAIASAADYIELTTWAEHPRTGYSSLFQPSMSWWLSQSVQAYLHRQVESPRNAAAMDTLVSYLRK